MKKVIFLTFIAVGFSSCMFVGHFGKRPLYLVGAPDDIQVKHNGKKVDVTEETMATLITRREVNGVRERTRYRHPAVLVKVRRKNKFEFTKGGKTAKMELKGKPGKGIVFLVLETPITLGIGTIVDLSTVSFFYPATKYIDVTAAFNNTSPKGKKELYKKALENSQKTIITEIRTR
jgi:hypothetical protein